MITALGILFVECDECVDLLNVMHVCFFKLKNLLLCNYLIFC